VPAQRLRAFASSLRGDLADARAAVTTLDDLVTEGVEAWARASARALIELLAGGVDAVAPALDAAVVGVAMPKDSELVIEIAMLRAQALAWQGDIDGARRAVDDGVDAVEHHRETHLHGWLAMAGVRVEADAAQATMSLADIEHAGARATSIARRWYDAVAELHRSSALVDAYSSAIAAEAARLRGKDIAERADLAARAFDAISVPYYATYFRWRAAEALLAGRDRRHATEMLKRARSDARAFGFRGLDTAISALARSYQLRVGPGRTTVDGREPLSRRELEVLGLVVEGKNNPDIAEQLFISRRTAAAHVSSILRKLGASSRVEAVSEAYRRGLVAGGERSRG
jgi:DNA-binding CsgD family transcriptional regulator